MRPRSPSPVHPRTGRSPRPHTTPTRVLPAPQQALTTHSPTRQHPQPASSQPTPPTVSTQPPRSHPSHNKHIPRPGHSQNVNQPPGLYTLNKLEFPPGRTSPGLVELAWGKHWTESGRQTVTALTSLVFVAWLPATRIRRSQKTGAGGVAIRPPSKAPRKARHPSHR